MTPLDYEQDYSHFHCWQQNPPACGIRKEDHKRCCLCEKLNPQSSNNLCKHGFPFGSSGSYCDCKRPPGDKKETTHCKNCECDRLTYYSVVDETSTCLCPCHNTPAMVKGSFVSELAATPPKPSQEAEDLRSTPERLSDQENERNEQAKRELVSSILACLPGPRPHEPGCDARIGGRCSCFACGFNSALDQFKENLKKKGII